MKAILKDKQYRKRKEIYQVDLVVLNKVLHGCDDLVTKAKRIKKPKVSRQNAVDTYNYYLYFDKLIE